MATTDNDAHIAMSRFGLGPSSRDLAAMKGDPRGWVRAQIDPTQPPVRDIPSSATELATSYAMRRKARENRAGGVNKMEAPYLRQAARTELAVMTTTDQPFAERLAAFWANHFTVSGTKGSIRRAIPAYVNEAIRPHVFGSFRDMLQAVVRHPVMLVYLDNTSSVGPNSRQGQRRSKGLNENLAREVLELHTLGPRGGYTQTDVTQFANILTGWGVRSRPRKAFEGEGDPSVGAFRFVPGRHEPGEKTLLGKTYAQEGVRQGRAALHNIAGHPSTATHIARKLASHFIADTPPDDVVASLAKTFRDTNGDLAAVSRALVDQSMAWSPPLSKIRTPYEFMVAALRVSGEPSRAADIRPRLFENALSSLSQTLNRPPAPSGWPDTQSDWITPASLMRRLEWAQSITRDRDFALAPVALYDLVAGPTADPDTRRLIAGAPSREQGQALALSSPDFQRR